MIDDNNIDIENDKRQRIDPASTLTTSISTIISDTINNNSSTIITPYPIIVCRIISVGDKPSILPKWNINHCNNNDDDNSNNHNESNNVPIGKVKPLFNKKNKNNQLKHLCNNVLLYNDSDKINDQIK